MPPPEVIPSATEAKPTKVELDRLLEEWKRGGMPFARELSVVDLFRARVAERPTGLALKSGGFELDFQTLDRLSNRVANRLLRAGLRREELVALVFDRSAAYAIGALGVLKAGGAYLPIDVATPDERRRFFLTDSEARFAITAPAHLERFRSWTGEAIPLDDAGESLAGEPETPVPAVSDPTRRAYVVYTSGSTGQPKGVEIEHHSLSNLVTVYHRWYGFTAEERGTMIANVAFDASVIDLWPCLCAGGAVLIPPKSLLTDLDQLMQWLAAEQVTFSFVPTALAEVMLGRRWPDPTALRFLVTGGDTLHVRPPHGLPFQVVNAYGPTENTVVSTWTVVDPEPAGEQPSIGRPLGNVKAYVLNDRGERVVPGAEGELFLGGGQVARGYLNRRELTKERFPADPFSDVPGAKMYRTGDWVRKRPDGELDFLGRQDGQVQIRGRRVELGEIEQAIHGYPGVRQACCCPVFDEHTIIGLVAHVAVEEGHPELERELHDSLAASLPPYMVPKEFVFYDTLPVTSNGKVDRRALRAPGRPAPSAMEMSLAVDSQELMLLELWYKFLPNARVGNHETTFESLGGDSFLAIKLLAAVEEVAGRRVSLTTFFRDPTLPGLCRAVRTSQPEKEESNIVVLRAEGSLPPVFCLYGVGGDVSHYYDLAKSLGPDQPVYAIRSPALTNLDQLPASIEAAAEPIAGWIRQLHPRGPLGLVGYSWGGLLAFEVARRWVEDPLPFVGLVGVTAPLLQVSTWQRLERFARRFPGWAASAVIDSIRGRRRLPKVATIAERLRNYVLHDPTAKKRPPTWATSPISRHHFTLVHTYRPIVEKPFQVDVIRERETYEEMGRLYRPESHPLFYPDTSYEIDGGWGRWVGLPPRVHWINTNHVNVVKPAGAKELADTLRAALAAHFAGATASAR